MVKKMFVIYAYILVHIIFDFNIETSFVNELINLNIETIGIFIAIIGGLIASKIISLNTECDEVTNRISQLDLEIEDIEKRLYEKKKENLENYKREAYEEIIDLTINNDSEYTLDDIWNPFVDLKQREEFVEEIKNIVRSKKEILEKCTKGEIETEESFLKACNVKKNSLEYEILMYIYDIWFL